MKRLDSLHQYEVDDSVMYEDDPNDAGIVIKKSESALYIEWDNGQKGWLNKFDLGVISHLPENWEDVGNAQT